MKTFTQGIITASIVLALSACGGGGDSEEAVVIAPQVPVTPQAPTIPEAAPSLELTSINLSNAQSLVVTGDDVVQSAKSSVNVGANASAKLGKQNVKTLNKVDGNTTGFSPNTLYKILADGTFEAVDILANNEDAGSLVSPKAVRSIGNGWTIVTFNAINVETIAKDNVNGQDNYAVISAEKETTYLVNNATSQAYKADFLGTPFFDYDQGTENVIERGYTDVDDAWGAIVLTQEQVDKIYSSIRFDDNNHLYAATWVPDYTSYTQGGTGFTVKESFVQIDLETMDVTEIPLVLNGDLDFASVAVSKDGSYLTYKDSYNRYMNTDTFVSLPIDLDNGDAFDYIFEAKGKSYGLVITSGISTGVHEINIDQGQLTTHNLTDSVSNASYSSQSRMIGGRVIVGDIGNYATFDVETGLFSELTDVYMWKLGETFIAEDFSDRHAYLLARKLSGATNISQWEPNSGEINTLNIDPDLYKITAFTVNHDTQLTLELTIINPLNGYTVGDKVIATLDTSDASNTPTIISTVSSNEPAFISLAALSQGDFIIIDGLSNDWAIDNRIASDDASEINGAVGDLAHLSMVENNDDIWFLIEADTPLKTVNTRFSLNDSEAIEFLRGRAFYDNGTDVVQLHTVGGLYASNGNNIEITLPKSIVSQALLAQIQTNTLTSVTNDVTVYHSFDENNISLQMTIKSPIDDLTFTLAPGVELVINEVPNINPSDTAIKTYEMTVDNVVIATSSGEIDELSGHVEFGLLISLQDIGVAYSDVSIAMTSNISKTLGETIDTLQGHQVN